MSERKRKSGHGKTDIVAIVAEETGLKAVELARRGRCLAVRWARSSDGLQRDLGRFAEQCGFAASAASGTKKRSGKVSVAGFNSSRVIFYRLDMPAVKSQELGSMIRLQAESRLPLAADQMELAWRTGDVRDGEVSVTIAAAKRDGMEAFVGNVRGFEPSRIMLNCEGIVKAWRMFFSGGDETAVIVSLGRRSAELCLSQRGVLANAVSLDIGTDELCGGDPAEQMRARERFVQDLRSVLELFGYSDVGDVPVFVLSDGGSAIGEIATCLASAGLNAAAAVPDMDMVTSDSEFGLEDVYEYRIPMGLGSIALDGAAETLDVFAGVYEPAGKKAGRRWYRSLKVTGTIAMVILMLLAGVHIAADVVSEKRLAKLQGTPEFQELIVRQRLIREVARQRPDLLELVKKINSIEGDGTMLHGIEFVRGRPVTIKGQSDNYENVFKFEENFLAVKGIEKSDSPMNMKKEQKGDKYTFTMSFNYKSFTKKSSK